MPLTALGTEGLDRKEPELLAQDFPIQSSLGKTVGTVIKEEPKEKKMSKNEIPENCITIRQPMTIEESIYGESPEYCILKKIDRLDLYGKEVKEINEELKADKNFMAYLSSFTLTGLGTNLKKIPARQTSNNEEEIDIMWGRDNHEAVEEAEEQIEPVRETKDLEKKEIKKEQEEKKISITEEVYKSEEELDPLEYEVEIVDKQIKENASKAKETNEDLEKTEEQENKDSTEREGQVDGIPAEVEKEQLAVTIEDNEENIAEESPTSEEAVEQDKPKQDLTKKENKQEASSQKEIVSDKETQTVEEETLSENEPDITETELQQSTTNKNKTRRYIVKYRNSKKQAGRRALEKVGTESINLFPGKKDKTFEIIETSEAVNPQELYEKITEENGDCYIEYIQPDYKLELSSTDPYFNLQWGLQNKEIIGEEKPYSIDIGAVPAWEKTAGKGAVIAVIDTGIDTIHEDLQESIWQNNKEIPDNGIDDDNNGYIDDVQGWNFANNEAKVMEKETIHGTNVAGIIAAAKDNDKGIAGVAPQAKIMVLKAFQEGQAYTSDVIEAIHYAQENGAQIVNCSWGIKGDNPALHDAMAEADDLLFICAAGNNHQNITQEQVSPASFDLPNVITVGAINSRGKLASFSNYSQKDVDVAAPGEDIATTAPENKYVLANGTSMSCAFVSGEAALLLSQNPKSSLRKIKREIITTSDHLSTLQGKTYQQNKINANNALEGIHPKNTDIINISDDGSEDPVTPVETPTDFLSLYNTVKNSTDQFNTIQGPSVMNGIRASQFSVWGEGKYQESVNPITGDLTIKQTDLSLPGRNGLDLNISRIYQSNQALLGSKRINYEGLIHSDYSTYFLNRYNLGIGWSFGFPSVQIEEDELSEGIYYHTGDGAVYRIDWGETSSNLAYYNKKDVKFESDKGTYNNGQEDSAYVFTTAEKTKQYFAKDGRLLAIIDRFGNEIKFKHELLPVVNHAPNPSFERENSRWPLWDINEYYEYKIPPEFIHCAHALKFRSTSNVSEDSKSIYIPVEPNTYYYLGGYIYNKLRSGLSGFTLEEYRNLKVTRPKEKHVQYVTEKDQWVHSEYLYKTDSDTHYVRLVFKNEDARGSSYLDNLVFDKAWPLITEITDTIGRKVTFNYDDTNCLEVTVQDPELTASTTLKYNKSPLWCEYLWPVLQNKGIRKELRVMPVLDSFDDGEKEYACYTGDKESCIKGNGWNWTVSHGDYSFYINEIELRNSKVKYEYEQTTKYMGEEGDYQTYRLKNRSEQYKTNDIYQGEEYKKSYTYEAIWEVPNGGGTAHCKNETGYNINRDIQYYEGFTTICTITQDNGLVEKKLFRIDDMDVGLAPYQTETASSAGEKQIITNLSYDSHFPQAPTKVKIEETNSKGTKTMYKGYTYNDWGGIASETKKLTWSQWHNSKTQHTTSYTYDDNYKLLKTRSYYQSPGVKLTETNNYDSKGRLIKTINAKGETTQFLYEKSKYPGNITTQKINHSDGRVTKKKYHYDSYGLYPDTITNYYTNYNGAQYHASDRFQYEYLRGNLLKKWNDEGQATRYAYDNMGRVSKISYAQACGETGDYNVEDILVYESCYLAGYGTEGHNAFRVRTYSTKTLKGQSTATTFAENCSYYDDHGNLLCSEDYDFECKLYNIATYYYNDYGQLAQVKDQKNNVTKYDIDEWDRLKSVTDAQNNKYIFTYDLYNRTKTTCFDPHTSGELVQNHYVEIYDQWGRTISKQGFPNGTPTNPGDKIEIKYDYDLVGNLVKLTDGRNNNTHYQYDALNRLIKVINALNEQVDYTYDRLGNLSQIKQYDGIETFQTSKTYDERGLILSQQPPAGNATTYKQNVVGLPYEITDAAGKTTALEYDLRRNVKEKSCNADTLKYYYHPLGLVDKYESLNNGNVQNTVDYQFYSTGLISHRTVDNKAVQFQYDILGNKTQSKDPFNYAVGYAYNNINRMSTVTAGGKTFTYQYYDDGMLKSITYPALKDGKIIKTEYTYDNIDRLKTLKNYKGTKILSQYSYQYDKNSNIKAINHDGATTRYEYDALNRLIKMNSITGETSEYKEYKYDSRGNRTQVIGAKATEIIPGEFSYTTWEEMQDFTTNSKNYHYDYDAEGFRTRKVTPETTTNYYYDNNGRIVAEANGQGQVTAQNIWGNRILARKIGSNMYYYLTNGHGDVVQILNENGNIVNSYNYDEWGNILNQTEQISNPIKYAGEYYDEESGLYYLRARYYDPIIGRFTSRDSYEGGISNPLSLNLYAYCVNNPLIYIDPSGHMEYEDMNVLNAQDYSIMQALTVLYGIYEEAGNIAMKEDIRVRAVSIRQKDEYKGKYSNSGKGGTYIDNYEYHSDKYQVLNISSSFGLRSNQSDYDIKVHTNYLTKDNIYRYGASPQTLPQIIYHYGSLVIPDGGVGISLFGLDLGMNELDKNYNPVGDKVQEGDVYIWVGNCAGGNHYFFRKDELYYQRSYSVMFFN